MKADAILPPGKILQCHFSIKWCKLLKHFNNKTLIKNLFDNSKLKTIRTFFIFIYLSFCIELVSYGKFLVDRNLLLVRKIVFELMSAVVRVMNESFITETVKIIEVKKIILKQMRLRNSPARIWSLICMNSVVKNKKDVSE